jgi:hypothetical protein
MGASPVRYRRCKCGVCYSLAKASHWIKLRRQRADDGVDPRKHESEDLQKVDDSLCGVHRPFEDARKCGCDNDCVTAVFYCQNGHAVAERGQAVFTQSGK